MTGQNSSIDKVFFYRLSDCFMDGDLLKLHKEAKPIQAKKTAENWKDRQDIVIIIVQENQPKVFNRKVITKLQGYETSKTINK